ncbi:hypothetical protein [Nonomuraea sp. NPDC050202]|uniref:hypothetical protein n=1 Tax=Nonomuraea sp. NPDC050202 TaxID=3155035 RepID=UPI0033EB7748
MSTSMTMDGRIDIEPSIPLTAARSRSDHNPEKYQGSRAGVPVDLVFDIEANPVTGWKMIVGLVPAMDYGRKLGSPYAEIQDLMATCGEGREFSGTLHIRDDEGGTSEITVEGGRVEWSDWEYPDDPADE